MMESARSVEEARIGRICCFRTDHSLRKRKTSCVSVFCRRRKKYKSLSASNRPQRVETQHTSTLVEASELAINHFAKGRACRFKRQSLTKKRSPRSSSFSSNVAKSTICSREINFQTPANYLWSFAVNGERLSAVD
jgi:hypothetical protein